MMHQHLHYNPFNPLPGEDNESKYDRLFNAESLYMAASGYSRNKDAFLFRDRAVFLISKYGQCENFPFIAYLTMNYFDRYMSRKNPVMDYPRYTQHDVCVVTFACLILAWQMKDSNFSTRRFLEERPEITEISAEQLASMEIKVFNELNWNMRAVTPFCFVPYFCDKLESKFGFRPRTICEIIVHAHDGMWITELRPSVIALSAFLAASDYLYPGEIVYFLCQVLFERNFIEVQRQIDTCTERMIQLCHDMNLAIESSVRENTSTAMFKLQAGRRYRSTHRGETSSSSAQGSGDVTKTCSQLSRYDKGKRKMYEQEEVRERQQDEGKNKWLEMYKETEIPKMAEDSEEMQFSFQLRWRAKGSDLGPLYEYFNAIAATEEAAPKKKVEAETETETESDQAKCPSDKPKCCNCRCNVL